MNGSLKLGAFGGRFYTVYGGAYRARPLNTVGIKMAEEIDASSTISIPTRDFSVPNTRQLIAGLGQALQYMTQGQALYVGCAAGRGRTGLFLSCLVKMWGIQKPVEYVRANYYPHAVENEEQYQYVQNLQFPLTLKLAVALAKARGWFGGPANMTRAVLGTVNRAA